MTDRNSRGETTATLFGPRQAVRAERLAAGGPAALSRVTHIRGGSPGRVDEGA
jgi:hypothetical protein